MNWKDSRELVRICKMYYMDGWTQERIAKKVGVSRPVISKMLQMARDTGIVHIDIRESTHVASDVEFQLERQFGLREAVVIPLPESDSKDLKRIVGRAAAEYLADKVPPGCSIGISWGETLFYFVEEFPHLKGTGCEVIPLVGGIGTDRVEIHSNQLAYELAKKLDGHTEFLYAPAIVESKELRRQLTESADISAVLDKGRHADLAVVGLASPFVDSTLVNAGYLNKSDLSSLKQSGVVGDMASRFYDGEGQSVNHPLNERVIGISLHDLKKVQTVVAVASGIQKSIPIIAALRGGYIDVLVIDRETAEVVLQQNQLDHRKLATPK